MKAPSQAASSAATTRSITVRGSSPTPPVGRTTAKRIASPYSCYVDEGMAELTVAQIEYLASQRLGRIATAGVNGKPHVVPTSFRYNADLGTIDVGGLHVATTKKFRDVQANGWAAIVVDDLVSIDPWTPRMLEIRGRAEAIETGGAHIGPGFGEAFIRIYPEKINSFGID